MQIIQMQIWLSIQYRKINIRKEDAGYISAVEDVKLGEDKKAKTA